LRRQPSAGVLVLRHRPGWAAPGEVRRNSPPGRLISAADMAAVLAATGTCSPMRRSSAGARGELRPAGDAGPRVPDRRAAPRADKSQWRARTEPGRAQFHAIPALGRTLGPVGPLSW